MRTRATRYTGLIEKQHRPGCHGYTTVEVALTSPILPMGKTTSSMIPTEGSACYIDARENHVAERPSRARTISLYSEDNF